MKKILSVLLATVLITSFAACGAGNSSAPQSSAAPAASSPDGGSAPASDEKAVILKVGGIQTTEDPSTEALYKMAELAKEKSGGSLTLEVYPASQLGNATAQVEAVGMGSQDMFVDAGWMGTFLQDKTIDSMWFLFQNAEHYDKYINSDLNKQMEEDFRELKGIRIIASNWYRAARSFVTKAPITTAADFSNMKIRVPELTGYLESVDAIGGKATQIAWSETYLALSQGVCDAAEGPLDNLYSMNFFEAAPNVTITEHNRDSMQVMINDRTFQNLSANQQEALTQAALEAGDWYTEQISTACEEALKAMEEKGANIAQLDPAELEKLREMVTARASELDASGKYWTAGMYQQIADMAE